MKKKLLLSIFIIAASISCGSVFANTDYLNFGVSHQIYPHKMLTDRKDRFLTPINTKISGYLSQGESEHDFFKVGHTSTSLALLTGMVKAKDLKGENIILLP